jgi:hypothetical protein
LTVDYREYDGGQNQRDEIIPYPCIERDDEGHNDHDKQMDQQKATHISLLMA